MAGLRVTGELPSTYQFLFARRTVERLVLDLPAGYVAGLDQILLRVAGSFTRREKKRKAAGKKKLIPLEQCLGTYYRSFRDRPARIELYVDNITRDWPVLILAIPPLADVIVGKVVFHELGHHIHATSDRRFSNQEEVAEEWRKRLSREYFRRKYGYLRPFGGLLRLLGRALKKLGKLLRALRGRRDRAA